MSTSTPSFVEDAQCVLINDDPKQVQLYVVIVQVQHLTLWLKDVCAAGCRMERAVLIPYICNYLSKQFKVFLQTSGTSENGRVY